MKMSEAIIKKSSLSRCYIKKEAFNFNNFLSFSEFVIPPNI